MQASVVRAGNVLFRLADCHECAGSHLEESTEVFASHHWLQLANAAIANDRSRGVPAKICGFIMIYDGIHEPRVVALAAHIEGRRNPLSHNRYSTFNMVTDTVPKRPDCSAESCLSGDHVVGSRTRNHICDAHDRGQLGLSLGSLRSEERGLTVQLPG